MLATKDERPMHVMFVYPPSVFSDEALTGTNRPVIFHPLGALGIADSGLARRDSAALPYKRHIL